METLALFTVVASIASLNVSTTELPTRAALDPSLGLTLTTDGAVVFASPKTPVVKLLVKGETTFPASSVTPLTVTVYAVLDASNAPGTKVNVMRSVLRLTAPATGVPAADKVSEPFPTLSGSSATLIDTSKRTFTGTPVAPFAGLTVAKLGAVVTAPKPVVKVDSKPISPWPSKSVALPG